MKGRCVMGGKNITIKITGKRFVGQTADEDMQFVTDATMYDRNGAKYLIYDESEFSGMPGCKTSLKLTDDMVRMKRIGKDIDSYGTELVFEKGKRFVSRYRTPYGDIDMEVLTKDIRKDLTEDGFGKITLNYDVSLHGMAEGRNEIDIEILQ